MLLASLCVVALGKGKSIADSDFSRWLVPADALS
jgi:hypothetical protein